MGWPHSVNLLLTSAANCTALSSLSSSRFRGGMLCCLCILAWLSASPQATDDLCRSLLPDTCDNASCVFSIFVQLRCRLSDSGCCHQERSRYTGYSRLGCCLNMVLARANSCSKQKSSSCSPALFVSPKPYSPTANDIADGSPLPTSPLKSPITSSMSPLGSSMSP